MNLGDITLIKNVAIRFTIIFSILSITHFLFNMVGEPTPMCALRTTFDHYINVIGHTITFISYIGIPFILYNFFYKHINNLDIPNKKEFKRSIILFCAFIISCGLYHMYYVVYTYINLYYVESYLIIILMLISLECFLRFYNIGNVLVNTLFLAKEKSDLIIDNIKLEKTLTSTKYTLDYTKINLNEALNEATFYETFYVNTIKYSPMNIMVLDKHLNYIVWSDSYLVDNDYSKDDVKNKNMKEHLKDFFDSEEGNKFVAIYKDVLENSNSYSEKKYVSDKGSYMRWIEPIEKNFQIGEERKNIGIVIYTINIDHLKK